MSDEVSGGYDQRAERGGEMTRAEVLGLITKLPLFDGKWPMEDQLRWYEALISIAVAVKKSEREK